MPIGAIKYILSNSYLLFIFLQQNIDKIKLENDDLQIKEDIIDMKSDYVDIPSASSVNEIKLEVSLVFSNLVVFFCGYVCFSIVQVILICHQIQRTPSVS
jgi:hypothetical protein